MPNYGYAGNILTIDLTTGQSQEKSSSSYTRDFIGGRGLAASLFWDLVPPEARAMDPENCLICASGPATGYAGFASFRWNMCATTPLGQPEYFSYANLGEKWGAMLKYLGYDALAVKGKAARLSYILISNTGAIIRDGADLKGLSTYDTIDRLKKVHGKEASVLTIGLAAENLVPFSTVFAEGGASGSGGMGAVMGGKNLKAIVVISQRKRPEAADLSRVKHLAKLVREGKPKEKPPSMFGVEGITRDHMCYGCGLGCARTIYDLTGVTYKAFCQAAFLYIDESTRTKGRKAGSHLLATRLCDVYGLDTAVMWTVIHWLDACFQEGLLDEQTTGLPLSKIGSDNFIEKLVKKIATREGFCGLIADGLVDAAAKLGPEYTDVLCRFVATRWGEKKDYDARTTLITGLFYAFEPRRPIQLLHEVVALVMAFVGMGGGDAGKFFSAKDFRKVAKTMWGGEIAADFSTYEGKALAAKNIQDRVYFKESLIICDLFWTSRQMSRSLNPADEEVTEKEIYEAITGNTLDANDVALIGERIFNLQRAILLRQGWKAREDDTLMDYLFTDPLSEGETFFNPKGIMPGKNGEIISRIGEVVEKDKFEDMKSEYYQLRGWNPESGLPTRKRLEDLGLKFVADDLETRGLLG